MRLIITLLALVALLPAADVAPSTVTLSNGVAEVELSNIQGRIKSFRLPGVKPIEYYGWHAEQLKTQGVRLPDPVRPLAVLDEFNPQGGGHNLLYFVGLPKIADSQAWTVVRTGDRQASFRWQEGETGPSWTLSYELPEGKTEIVSTLVINNSSASDLDLQPTIIPVNGIHQDDPAADSYYVTVGRHYGGTATNGIENLGLPEPEKEILVSPENLDYVVLKSRFFAALFAPGSCHITGGAVIPPSAPVVASTAPVVTPAGVATSAAPKAVTAVGAGNVLHISAVGYALPAALGGTKQAYLKAGYTAQGGKIVLKPGQTLTMNWRLTAAALDTTGLARLEVIERKAEFTEAYYRFFRILSDVCTWLLGHVAWIVRNYGVAILLLTFLIKLALHRTTFKQQESMMKMQKLQPELKLLQETYKSDKQKLAAKQMELWKKNGVNPLGGCLPILIQIPIFTALYMSFSHSADMRGHGFLWIKDLTLPDAVWGWVLPWSLPLLGNILTLNPLPIIYIGVTVWMSLSQKLPTGGDPAQEQTMKMMRWMPVVFGFIFYSMPSGLVLYFTANAVLSTIEIKMVKKKLGIA